MRLDPTNTNTPALVSRSLPSSREALPVIISSLDLSDEGSPVHANSPTSLPVVISSLYLFRSRELSDDCSPLLPLSSLSQRAVRHLRCDSHLPSSLSPGAMPRKKRPSLTKPLSPSFDCARLKSQPRSITAEKQEVPSFSGELGTMAIDDFISRIQGAVVILSLCG
ncbi:hypothetical protein CKAN_02125700 [Cinnamomum micranthum f. kanehirae]|uniref:Uncharacterized protein n=1 Tax=Cinnamomum micranthum f. kanehirae TaxID=337451 RepID=A0A3S3NH20_9MAGN|nr:hypothetical protein CKAN_02125700 [Cinnamomum micranthum f. kanehirae]